MTAISKPRIMIVCHGTWACTSALPFRVTGLGRDPTAAYKEWCRNWRLMLGINDDVGSIPSYKHKPLVG